MLVLTELNADALIDCPGELRFGQAEHEVDRGALELGGCGAITAAALAAQGVRVAISATAGADGLGRFVLARLADLGVDTQAVRMDPSGPTGMTVVLTRPDGDRAMLTAPGVMPTVTADGARSALVRPSRHVHVSSFYLQRGLQAGLPDLLGHARATGRTTSLDPGWDPGQRWASIAPVLPHLDYFLPNETECLHIAAATGFPADDPLRAAQALAANGPTVVVKLGQRGAAWVTSESVRVVRAVPVDVVETTGAGDNLNAGVIAGLLDAVTVAEILARGIACGSAAVTGVGGTGCLLDRMSAGRSAASVLSQQ